MLTLEAYLMGRRELYPDEWNIEYEANAGDLIKRVNNLLTAISVDEVQVSSGWRPLAVNMRAGGAKRSLHMVCKAVDLVDTNGSLKATISRHPELLRDFGLWMEDPASTPNWCHLDTSMNRQDRPVRIFKP